MAGTDAERVALCPRCREAGHIGEIVYTLEGAVCARCWQQWLYPRPPAVCDICERHPAHFINRSISLCTTCLVTLAPCREPDR